ncbi:MAG: sensor histidine kinase [Rhodospirillales bacterium]
MPDKPDKKSQQSRSEKGDGKAGGGGKMRPSGALVAPPSAVVRQAEEEAVQVVRRLSERLTGGEERLLDLALEIRTPMSALLAYSDMLRRADTLKLSRTQVMDYAATIHEATLRVLATTERSLERHLTGKLDFKPEPVDLYPFVSVLLKAFTGQAQRQKIELALDIQQGFPQLRLDRILLNSVLSSLIANALMFTSSGGAVSVRARTEEKSGALVLAVSDTGMQFPMDTLEAVEKGEIPAPTEGEERGWRRSFKEMYERIAVLDGVLTLANLGNKGAVARIRFPASAAASAKAPAE